MILPLVLVAHLPNDGARAEIRDELRDAAEVRFWPELSRSERDGALRRARAVMTYDPLRDLGREEVTRLDACGLI